MKVIGDNSNYGLAGSLNDQTSGSEKIKTPCNSPLNPNSLLSFSTYSHSVWIMQNGEAVVVGDNIHGQIMSTMPKETFQEDTKIEFQYKNGKRCKFTSAVCGRDYTLYKVSGETNSDSSQLVYAHSGKETIFLNIGKRSPVSLFGGWSTSAAIDAEGGVIIITASVFNSPESEVECLSLPDCDKAVKAACGDDSVIVVGESGRVFECRLGGRKKSFSEVVELSGIKINEISGTSKHFFAVSEDRRVFGRGDNLYNRLGIPSDIKQLSKFELIESMNKYHVVEAFAGVWDSFFKTSEGEIFGCGWNCYRELMLKDSYIFNVYPPAETTITRDVTFCIIGNFKSVVFLGVEPPPNTPNRKINFSKTVNKAKSASKSIKTSKEIEEENKKLRNLLEKTQKENSTLKEELAQSKKRISELEKEVEELKEKSGSSSQLKSKKVRSEIDIISSETLNKLKRVKSIGRGAKSEVFMVSQEELFFVKIKSFCIQIL